MQIRQLKDEDDLQEIKNIYKESWTFAYKDILDNERMKKIIERNWHPLLKSSSRENLLLLDQERPVGTASFSPARCTEEDTAELISLYLLPPYIGRGLGKDLIDEVFRTLRAKDFRTLELWCHERNVWARLFYEKVGFTLLESGSKIREFAGEKHILFKYFKDL